MAEPPALPDLPPSLPELPPLQQADPFQDFEYDAVDSPRADTLTNVTPSAPTDVNAQGDPFQDFEYEADSPRVASTANGAPLEGRQVAYVVGEHIWAQWIEDETWYKAVVQEVRAEEYLVTFTEYGNQQLCSSAMCSKDFVVEEESEKGEQGQEETQDGEDLPVGEMLLPYCVLVHVLDLCWKSQQKQDLLSFALTCRANAAALSSYVADRNRLMVFREMCESEASYLHVIAPIFSYAPKGLSASAHMKLFNNVETIIKLNSVLYRELRERLRSWRPESRVADIFLRFGPSLKLYSSYSAGQNDSTAVVEKLYSSKKIDHLEQARLAQALISPVQRIPRYMLLLKEILKRTPEGHPDQQELPRAIALVDSVAMGLNSAVKTKQDGSHMLSILADISGLPPSFGPQTLIRSGVGKLAKEDSKKKGKPALVVLLNSGLIIAEKGKPWKYMMTIQVNRALKATPAAPSRSPRLSRNSGRFSSPKVSRKSKSHSPRPSGRSLAVGGEESTLLIEQEELRLLFEVASTSDRNGWISDIERSVVGKINEKKSRQAAMSAQFTQQDL